MKIEKLRLSDRTYNALLRNGIATVEQLRQLSDRELQEMKGLGTMTIAEIRSKVPYGSAAEKGLLVMGKWEPATNPPLMPGQYIVYIKEARRAAALYYGDGHWYDEDGNWYEVLYWMELPRLPQLPEVGA